MKMSIALESREKAFLEKLCRTDPCKEINCEEIDSCECCPLHSAIVAFNEARHNLREAIAKMTTVESEGK